MREGGREGGREGENVSIHVHVCEDCTALDYTQLGYQHTQAIFLAIIILPLHHLLTALATSTIYHKLSSDHKHKHITQHFTHVTQQGSRNGNNIIVAQTIVMLTS